MPDLLTHYAAARIPGSLLRDRRIQAIFIFGTFLPDLAAKGLYWILHAPEDFDTPTHSIPGLLALSYLAALFVEERIRKPAFAALLGGGIVHVAVDLIKDNQGAGSAYLFHPFSTAGVEIGWINPENVIYLVPLDLAILAALWAWERKGLRVQQ